MSHIKAYFALLQWRYWPMEFLYLPLTLYIFFIGSLRTRRLFYFSATNPKVPLGGFASDSKNNILEKVPTEHKPITLLISQKYPSSILIHQLINSGITFPCIAKPDLGEGGFLVRKIVNESELLEYHAKHSMNYLIQELINDTLEVSILVHNTNGKLLISSITERRPLTLTGDGRLTIKQLLQKEGSIYLRLKKKLADYPISLNHIPKEGELIQPFYIGNLEYGASYFERKDLISEDLNNIIESINDKIGLFNYARYDIKCKNVEELIKGNFKILEINGVKGEPIHIYDSAYTLYRAYKEIFKHWEYILKISKRNITLGCDCATISEGFSMLKYHYLSKRNALKPKTIQ